MNYINKVKSPIGTLTIASDGKNLTGLWMEEQKYYGSTLDEKYEETSSLPIFVEVNKWLEQYFAGKNPKINFSLSPTGSDFRQMVWKILSDIPYGEVITYGDIAKKIAKKTGQKNVSAQAVGGAVGHNPISIIIPCHRVVGSNGSLTGYAGGIKKKTTLLELEKVDTSKLSTPKKGTAL